MSSRDLTLAERLKRHSHRICTHILQSDVEWIDIQIEIERMRQMCEAEAPEKLDLFEALYVARFTRLWQQWREPQHRTADDAGASLGPKMERGEHRRELSRRIIEGEWRETRGEQNGCPG